MYSMPEVQLLLNYLFADNWNKVLTSLISFRVLASRQQSET